MNTKITVPDILRRKDTQQKIVAITSYNFLTAKLVHEYVDIILVGDSISQVLFGENSTLSIPFEVMLYCAKSVRKAVKNSMLVFDMPFGSYQISKEDARKNIVKVMKETGADAVKMEGGLEISELVKEITNIGVPVMGHIGMLPQSVKKYGGYKIQGRDEQTAEKIFRDAKELEKSGVFSIVLEALPYSLAKRITEEIKIPTIGIGAGPYCDGQIIVLEDIIGLTDTPPSFVRRYENLSEKIKNAVSEFSKDVRENRYPSLSESYK